MNSADASKFLFGKKVYQVGIGENEIILYIDDCITVLIEGSYVSDGVCKLDELVLYSLSGIIEIIEHNDFLKIITCKGSLKFSKMNDGFASLVISKGDLVLFNF